MGVVAVSLVSLALASNAQAPGIAWRQDLGHALKSAQKSHQVVMIDFWAKWCSWCQQLDTGTYVDPRVVALSRDFVPVKVSTEGGLAEMEATERYDVSTLPTILFLTPAGVPVMRVEAFQAADEFAQTLDAARAKGREVMQIERKLAHNSKDPSALADLGRHLFEQKDLKHGRQLLSKSMREDASLPAAQRQATRLLMARVHLREKKYADAVAVLREAQGLDPTGALVPEVLVELGRAYVGLDKPKEAREILQRVAGRDADAAATAEAKTLIAALEASHTR